SATHLAVDTDANLIITGTLQGSADFDFGPAVHALNNPTASFVWKISTDGDYQWARLSYADILNFAGVATDSAGDVIVTGTSHLGAVIDPDIPNGSIDGHGSENSFVWKLTPAGQTAWLLSYVPDTSTDYAFITEPAVDDGGNVAFGITFSHTLD